MERWRCRALNLGAFNHSTACTALTLALLLEEDGGGASFRLLGADFLFGIDAYMAPVPLFVLSWGKITARRAPRGPFQSSARRRRRRRRGLGLSNDEASLPGRGVVASIKVHRGAAPRLCRTSDCWIAWIARDSAACHRSDARMRSHRTAGAGQIQTATHTEVRRSDTRYHLGCLLDTK